MKLKQFLSESPYKSTIIFGMALMVFTFMLLIANVIFSFFAVNRALNIVKSTTIENREVFHNWENEEQQNLWKEKFWIENQIRVSKEDSMSLGINFKDSTIQLQFKGLPLIKSRIARTWPEHFLSSLSAENYSKIFGRLLTIDNANANISKRPFRKMIVTAEGNTQAVDTLTYKPKAFSWSFVTNNNIRIVIKGYGTDSLEVVPSFRYDVLKFRIAEKTISPFTDFTPTLFIWINDKEAEAIYRALPKNASVIVRN